MVQQTTYIMKQKHRKKGKGLFFGGYTPNDLKAPTSFSFFLSFYFFTFTFV
jgi:hypothetical protein